MVKLAKRYLALLIMNFFIMNVFLSAIPAKAEIIQPIIKNGDFELGLNYWGTWKSSGEFTVETDKVVRKTGINSTKIYNKTSQVARGSISQTIDRLDLVGKVLKVTQNVKSENLIGSVKLRAKYVDSNWAQIGDLDIKTLDISGTKDWNMQVYSFDVPNDTRIKKVVIEYLYDSCTGSLWVDDVVGEKTEKVVTSNLIKNGGFEEGISYWSTWKASGEYTAETDKVVRKTGVSSTKIYSKTSQVARGSISQIIDGTGLVGKALKVTQNVKSENLIGSVKLRAKYVDTNWVQIGDLDIKTVDISGTKDWSPQVYFFDVPNDTRIKKVIIEYLYDNCTGAVWLDDVVGEKTERTISNNLVKNGSFEEGISYWDLWNGNGQFIAETDKLIKKSGYTSIKLHSNGSSLARGIVKQILNFGDGLSNYKSLSVSTAIKTDKLSGERIQLRVRFIDGSNQSLYVDRYISMGVSPTEDWKTLSYKVPIPANINTKTVEITYIFNNCIGSLWLDDVNVQKSTVEEKVDLVQNGGFESTIANSSLGLNDWGITGNNSVKIDKINKKDGNNSLQIIGNSIVSNSYVTEYIGLPSDYINKTIKLSQWVKTSNLVSRSVALSIGYYDKDGNLIESSKSKNVTVAPTSDWILLENNFDVPDNPNITNILIKFIIRDSGTIWLDSIKAEPYVKIKDIGVTPSVVDINVGESKTIQSQVNPTNYTYKNISAISLDESIASLSNSTSVKGLKKGITKLMLGQSYQGITKYVPIVVGKTNEISVTQINNVSTVENEKFSGKVYGKTINKNLQYSVYIDGQNGYVDLKGDGSFDYYPNSSFYGKDSFTVLLTDSNGAFNVSQYNIEIQKVNELPNVEDFSVNIKQEDGKVSGRISNWQQLSGIQLSINKNPSYGSFVLAVDGSYTYTPNVNFSGNDSVEIKVSNSFGLSKVIKATIYVAPSIQTITQTLNTEHPRIIASKSDFDRIKLLIKSDQNALNWFNRIKSNTDIILNQPVIPYQKSDGIRLKTTSKNYIEQLSFMYRVTGDIKYANRAWLELQNICVSYPDWNDKGEFLNTATMSVAASIGYDWLYDYLNNSQKSTIETAIINKALNKALPLYMSDNINFVEDKNNWNFVCNSGLIVGALAIADKGNVPAQVLQQGLKSIQNSVNTYFSDGSGIEGPRYWTFVTEYLTYVNPSLKIALKGSVNLSSKIDLEQLIKYSSYITGNTGVFNTSDTDDDFIPSYYNLWAAKEVNKGSLTQINKVKPNGSSIYDLIWYDPALYSSTNSSNIPLDKFYKDNQITSMRSDFINNLGSYVAYKGGLAGAPHGDLDIGSFVYDALGVRWAIDLGSENYNVPGYWDSDSNGARWKYYRKRAEGHNTLTIGQAYNEDQVIGSYSKVISSNLNVSEPYSVIDMTPAYSDKAVNVQRELRLKNNRKDLMVTDSFVLKSEDNVAWQMHTRAAVTIVDGGKGVILEQDYKKLYMKLNSNSNMVFQVEDAIPGVGSPNPSGQTKNDGVKKIVVRSKMKSGSISVLMSPLANDSPMIMNGGFESGLKYWNTWKSSGDFAAEIDTTIKKSGISSVKIYNKTSGVARGSISQVLDGDFAGKLLKINQNLRSDNLVGAIKLRANFMDSNWTQVGTQDVKTVNISGTKDWSNQLYSIQVPNDTRIKKIAIEYLYDSCTGVLWLDDLTGEKTEPVVTTNLVKNNSFEEGLSYWNTWNASGYFTAEIDAIVKKSGTSSVKIYNKTSGVARGSISQVLDGSFSGKLLKVGQNIKSENLVGAIRLRAKFMDSNWVQIGNLDIKTIDIIGTKDWNNQLYSIQIPNDTRISKVVIEYLYDSCTGVLWLDDLFAEKTEPVLTNNLLKNGTFEEGLSYWNTWKASGDFYSEVDKLVKKSGMSSTKIYNKTAVVSRGSISQVLDGDYAGKLLKVTQNVKSENLSGAIRLRTKFMDSNWGQVGNLDIKTVNITGTQDWNNQVSLVQIPNDIRIKKVVIEYLYDNCTGVVWVDDIEAGF